MTRYSKYPNQNLQGVVPAGPQNVSQNIGSNRVFWCDRDPTTNDFDNWFIGSRWISYAAGSTADPTVWMLVRKTIGAGHTKTALWIRFYTGAVVAETLTGDSGGAVGPDGADNINLLSGITGLTVDGNPGTNTLTLNSSGGGNLLQSLRGDGGTQVYPVAAGYIDLLGTANQIVTTEDAGNNKITWSLDGAVANSYTTDNGTATPVANVLDFDAETQAGGTVWFSGATNVVSLNTTDANGNTAIGLNSGAMLAGAANNTILGNDGASNLVGGDENVIIGESAGSLYTTNESSNILIKNSGVTTENNTIHIGTQGAGVGQQSTAYMAGIFQAATAATREVVFIDSTCKLGSDSFSSLSWTPTLTFGGASVGIIYGPREGNYQTLGNLVFYSGSIVLTNKGTSVGLARVGGLPFVASGILQSQMGTMASSYVTYGAGCTYVWCYNEIGTTNLYMSSGGTGVVQTVLNNTSFANNTQITVSGFYFKA